MTYLSAACNSSGLPSFAVSSSGKYEVSRLDIRGNVQVIPANHFAAFASIDILTLTQTATDTVPQQWDEKAFDGVDIRPIISVSGLGNLVPFPQALITLGKKGLTDLFIDRSSSVELTNSTFKEFPSLTRVQFNHTQITKLENGAFAGLENSLQYLYLQNVGLVEFPLTQLSILNKLSRLDLESNRIQNIPAKICTTLPKLVTLDVDNNPIQEIGSDAFLSNDVTVDLRNTTLASIDLSLFLFNDVGGGYVYLDNSVLLKSIRMSDKVISQYSGPYISIQNTALETIDPKLGDFLSRNNAVKINIQGSVHLQCGNLAWMAPYVLCSPQKIYTAGAWCADKPLDEYLKSVVPNPCG